MNEHQQAPDHDSLSENILLNIEEGVATVLLNRPDKLNALSADLLEDLSTALVGLDSDDEVMAVVITGSPEAKRPAFAAGADIAEMSEMGGLQLRAYSHLGQQTFSLIEGMAKPVIAAINGFALGGGCELAMACHFRYASEGAKLGQPEVNLGIIPGFGGTQRLVRLVGRGRALEMLLDGDPIDAAEALRVGLVNKVFPADELLEAATAKARSLAKKAPLAVQLILDAVGRGAEMTEEPALSMESDLFGLVGTTDDVREGMKAFLEKRPAQWKGR